MTRSDGEKEHDPCCRETLKEFPDYYERLELMEREAKRDWAANRGGARPA